MFGKICCKEFCGFKNGVLEEMVDNAIIGKFDNVKSKFNKKIENFGELISLYKSHGFKMESMIFELFKKRIMLNDIEISVEYVNKFVSSIQEDLNCNYNFRLHLMFVIILRNLNLNEHYQEEIASLAFNIKFDETMLITLLAINEEFIPLECVVREKMIEAMNTDKFNLDMDKLLYLMYNGSVLEEKSEYSMVKSINKILKLKLKDFKGNESVLDSIKEYRLIGTADGSYDKVCDTMKLTSCQYYALSLKVCNETYVKGAPRRHANKVIYRHLNNSIDIFTNDVVKYLEICSRDENKILILKPIDINVSKELKEKMYNNLEEIYIKKEDKLDVSIVCPLLMDDRFFNIVETHIKKVEYKYYLGDYIVNILKQDLSEDFKCKYFNLFDSYKLNISENNLYELILMDMISLKDVFSEDSKYIKPMKYMLDEIFKYEFESMFDDNKFILFAELFYNEMLTLKRIDRNYRGYTSIYKIERRLYKIYQKNDIDLDLKRNVVLLLEKYSFAFVNPLKGNSYSLFILNNIHDDFFKSVLGITDDDVRDIANYLLANAKNLNVSHIKKINRLILSEDEYQLIEDKRELKSLLLSYKNYSSINGVKSQVEKIADFISNSNNKKVLIQCIIDYVNSWELADRYIGLVYILIIGLNKCGVIADKEKEEILEKINGIIENIFE